MTDTTQQHEQADPTVSLVDEVLSLGREVGYVALGRGQQITMRLAPGVMTETTEESNRYEELLVNPTLLTLASQRGRIDCGGLEFIVVGYGDFQQLIMPILGGHISIGLLRDTPVRAFVERVTALLVKAELTPESINNQGYGF